VVLSIPPAISPSISSHKMAPFLAYCGWVPPHSSRNKCSQCIVPSGLKQSPFILAPLTPSVGHRVPRSVSEADFLG
jgi:hypothetical protein